MPGILRRRLPDDEDDDGEDNDRASPSSTNDASSARATPQANGAHKRQRLSTEQQDNEEGDSWMLDAPGTVRRAQNARASTAPRASPAPRRALHANSTIATSGAPVDPADFKPGQLLRVHVRNFVTYTDATFHPGPSLNMIIGPNGTGKSTLVCAICIGLGFSTSHLGRAKELSEFVKHGCRDASIEIELKGFPGKTNKVVHLDFLKEGEKKQWMLDGRQCRAKDINEVVAKFGIQIDNLCHFLPQDRVVEFSRLSSKDRLTSTLRAAAPAKMTEQHEELKRLAAERKKLHEEQVQKKAQLKHLEGRQTSQRGDVERMRERQDIIKQVERLKKMTPLAKHMAARKEFEDAKAEEGQLNEELQILNAQVEPFDQAVKEKEKYGVRVKKVVDGRKKLCDQVEKQALNCKKEQEKIDKDIHDLDQKKEQETKAFRARSKQISDIQGNISRVETQMEQQPIEIDAAEYNRKINDKVREARAQQQSLQDIRDQAVGRSREIEVKKQQVHYKDQELKNLHSASGQQRNKLAQMSQDTLKAWDWIEKNRHQFNKPVLGPPILTCKVKDTRYAPMIESLFGKKDFLRITCTDFEDWKMLQTVLSEELSLFDFALFNSKTPLEEFTRPMDEDAMRQLGLEGWALDFLEGPDDVLAMLCDYSKINTTGIVWQDVSTPQYEALMRTGLSSWVTSKTAYRVTRRREYGDAANSTRTVNVPDQARIWSSQGVDAGAEADIKEQIVRLRSEIDDIEEVQSNTRARIEAINRTIKQLQDEKVINPSQLPTMTC